MTTHRPVPADVEPTSMTELYDDCREVSGVLAPWYTGAIRMPAPRDTSTWAVPSGIPLSVAEAFDYGDYGS